MLSINSQLSSHITHDNKRHTKDVSFKSAASTAKAAEVLRDTFKNVDIDKISRMEKFFLKLSTKVPDTVFKSKAFEYLSNMAEKYPAVFEAFTALGITSTIRPLTVLAVPGADIEDKKYAATKSVVSGALGFGVSLVAYKPLGKVIDKLGDGSYQGLKLPWAKNTTQFKAFSFLTNYGFKFVIGIPTAVLIFKLIPVAMKVLFPNRKKKPMDNYNPPIASAKLSQDQQKVYDQIVAYARCKGEDR